MSNSQASDPIDHKEKLELKLYTTKLTYSELQALAMDIRRGNANHDDNVIAEWIKVCNFMPSRKNSPCSFCFS